MSREKILEFAHRWCSRYRHGEEFPYLFNEYHLLEFVRRLHPAPRKPEQDEEPTKAEVAVYLFAGWLTCQPGIMEVGACCDASLMAQAIDQYFQEHPERMFETKLHPAARPEFVRLSEEEIMDLCRGKCVEFRWPSTAIETARAIEDALEEKNK